ncbi:MAG: SxtJ family membrane protein [Chthoniobacteraceae bacterium]
MPLDPVTREKRLETLSVLAGFCFVVALIKLHRGGSPQALMWWMEAGVVLLIVGLFIGPLATLIAQLWLKLSHLMGAVMSRLLLSLVFFLLLLPLALLRRLITRRDELHLKRKTNGASYYTEEVRTYTARDLQFPW